MAFHPDIADPERRLSLAYAPRACRDALALSWALDERLGAIVAATREAMLGEIRLAWWRDALLALDSGAPKGEPLLEALHETVRVYGLSPADLATLPDGWSVLLEPMPLSRDALDRYARGRGSTLFGLAAQLLGDCADGMAEAGAGWALADLGFRVSNPETARQALLRGGALLTGVHNRRWPGRLRALAVLVALARRDCAAGHLQRRQGSPARLARMIWAGMSGR
jgi:phytoene synthase